MSMAKNLQTCKIIPGSYSRRTTFSSHKNILLVHLKSITIDDKDVNDSIHDLLKPFILPALQFLKVTSPEHLSFQAIYSLMQRSHCPLTELCLESEVGIWSTADLAQLLNLLPTLTSLYVGLIISSSSLKEIFQTVFPPDIHQFSTRPTIQKFACIWKWPFAWINHNHWDFVSEIFGPSYHDMQVNYRTQPPKTIDITLVALPLLVQDQRLSIPEDAIQIIQDLERDGWEWSCWATSGRLMERNLLSVSGVE